MSKNNDKLDFEYIKLLYEVMEELIYVRFIEMKRVSIGKLNI